MGGKIGMELKLTQRKRERERESIPSKRGRSRWGVIYNIL